MADNYLLFCHLINLRSHLSETDFIMPHILRAAPKALKHTDNGEELTKNFKGGTSPRIYPWNQSQIENRKSSSPRIYPWGESKI